MTDNNTERKQDPLHGLTLKMIVTQLEEILNVLKMIQALTPV